MSDFDQELDARGLNCPLPILRAKKALNGMAAGEVLKIVSGLSTAFDTIRGPSPPSNVQATNRECTYARS